MSDAETSELRRRLEDVETANHGLRIELHVTLANLQAQQCATASLARGAAFAKSAHLDDVARLSAELARAKAEIADRDRAILSQAGVIEKLGAELERLTPKL